MSPCRYDIQQLTAACTCLFEMFMGPHNLAFFAYMAERYTCEVSGCCEAPPAHCHPQLPPCSMSISAAEPGIPQPADCALLAA